jgi:hypothetical protein
MSDDTRTRTSADIGELAKALATVQGAIFGAVKDSTNPFFCKNYADLAAVWDACRKPLAAAGLAVIQAPCTVNEPTGLTTILAHASGQWVESTIIGTSKDAGPQALGSLLTYLRRYSLAAIIGIPQVDDDGNDAQKAHDTAPARAQAPVTSARIPAPAPVGAFGLTVKKVEARPGTSKKTGKPYQMWAVYFSDGRSAITFDAATADLCAVWAKSGATVDAALEGEAVKLKIVSIEVVHQIQQDPLADDNGELII